MNKILLTFFFFVAVVSASAQGKKNAPELKRNFADTLTFEWINGHVVIPVEIGGKTRKYVYDTGASGHIMSEKVYENSKILKEKQLSIGDYGGKRKYGKQVVHETYKIGNMVFRNTTALVLPFDYPYWGCYEIEGLIGMIDGLIVKIDYRNKHIIFTNNKKLFDTKKGVTEKYYLNKHNKPYVQSTPFGDEYGSFGHLFDTGDGGLLAISNSEFDYAVSRSSKILKYKIAETVGANNVGINGLENETKKYLIRTDDYKVLGLHFSNVIDISTRRVTSVGSDLLKYGEVIMDNISHRITMIPYDGVTSHRLQNSVPDLKWVYIDDNYYIGLIWEESESYKYGLRKGDQILEVNGLIIGEYCETIKWLGEELDKDNFKIKVRNAKGEELEFDVKRSRRVGDPQ